MKKKTLIFYFSILLMFCQVFAVIPSVTAISEATTNSIIDNCDYIKDSLKNVQKNDARARVYLGGYYETILTKFITPLNVRLVENNLSSADLIENQNGFAVSKQTFVNDFISYQQILEELVAMDCKKEPDQFYEKLEKVRQKRKTMAQDVLKMRNLLSEHIKLVKGLRAKL